MSAVASTSTYSFSTKDAAAKEREDRLLAAKKKLKLYRARTSQRGSNASTATLDSPVRNPRRQSGLTSSVSSNADFAAKHAHRRSQSKSGLLAAMGGDAFVGAAGGPGHARRMSKNRASRSSISLKKGHGHNRSRASISMSFSGPAPQLAPPSSSSAAEPERSITPTPRQPSGLGAPSSWLQNGGFPSTSPDLARPSSIIRSTSPLPPAPAPGPQPSKHGRHGSRHARQSSVSNFRESIDLVGGGTAHNVDSLRPAVSSFVNAHDGAASPAASASPLPSAGWSSTDPHHVLAALKERGRREVDDPSLSPEQTRQFALEALEGRVSAPSEIISLGNEEPGELLSAPKSPGFTTSTGFASPLPPSAPYIASPMIGLGVSGGPGAKRSSWGPMSGVAGVGAQGVMELGGIAEEDEEEEDEYVRGGKRTPVSSPKRSSPSPRKGRPSTILVEPRSIEAVATSTPAAQTSPVASYSPTASRRSSIRPLSLSLSSSSSVFGTPSTASVGGERRTSLAAPSSPDDMRTPSSPGDTRRISMFHAAAAMGLEPSASALATQSAIAQRGGLRSLSIGGHSPTGATERRFPTRSASVSTTSTSPELNRRNSLLSASAPASSAPQRKAPPPPLAKRSSLQYRTSSERVSTPEKSWRSSLTAVGEGSTPSPAISTAHYSHFPLGVAGGFGGLEMDDQPSPSRRSFPASPTRSTASASTASAAAAAAAAAEEISSLRAQVSSLETRNAQLASTHALEIDEFEKKASDEAHEMRARIGALEAQVEDERVARRFEVEGLQREVHMAKEAIQDLTDERDALREDVDGWRARCAKLEGVVKKEREDEALAQAQAKLIGEMRDQIYNLVAAVERERGEHAETRKEVERMLEERVREAAAEAAKVKGGRADDLALIVEEDEDDYEDIDDDEDEVLDQRRPSHHPYKNASDGSMLSTASSTFSRSVSYSGNTTEDTSIMTDLDDSFSTKLSSPPSGHSSFSAVVGGPLPPPASANPNRGSVRDADAVAAALGQLDTLAEEDEEDDEAALGGTPATVTAPQYQDERARLSSTSTASTSSDVMPRTPDKTQADHNRSHSFVRHWSFPRGSVTSARPSFEEEDNSFFGYNKHDSLPPLPIGDHVLPPFLTSTLDVDEDHFSFFPPAEGTVEVANHVRRPSSPRPLERVPNPHVRRISGQYGGAPPPSPSAIRAAALQHTSAHSSINLGHPQSYSISSAPASSSPVKPAAASAAGSRYSFGGLIGSLGGWSGSASVPSQPHNLPAGKLAFAPQASPVVEEVEDDTEGVEEDVFITTHDPRAPPPRSQPQPQPQSQQAKVRPTGTPLQLQHQNHAQGHLRYIQKHEAPRPVAARVGKLDFTRAVCCVDMPVFVV
ncbi:hypothetical protein JCM10207_007616 [Rhodosporidiobolus poonsookiae]